MFKSIYNQKVSMQERKEKAQLYREQLQREQKDIAPMLPFEGKMTTTALGRHWCDNFDFYSELKTQTYFAKQCLRIGGVCHLAISQGTITAIVSDTEPCTVTITIPPVDSDHLAVMQQEIEKSHLSVVNFRRGRLPENLVKTLCTPRCGLIPALQAITATCTCGRQGFCLHVLAVLFGIGRLLDTAPLLAFCLRGIEAWDLYPSGHNVHKKGKQPGQASRPAVIQTRTGSKTSDKTKSKNAGTVQASAILKPVAEDTDAHTPGDSGAEPNVNARSEDKPDVNKLDMDMLDKDMLDKDVVDLTDCEVETPVPDEIQLPESRPRALRRPASDMYISGVFSEQNSDEDFNRAVQDLNESHLVEEMTDFSFLYDMDDDGVVIDSDPHMDMVLEKMWSLLDLSAMLHFTANIQKVFSSPRLHKQFESGIDRISQAEFLFHGARARKWQEDVEHLSDDKIRDLATTGVAIVMYRMITELAEGKPLPMKLFANSDPDTETAVQQENSSAGENLDQANTNARNNLEQYRDAQKTFTDPDECMKIDNMYARVLDSPKLTRKFFEIFARDYPAPLVSLVAAARLAEMGCPAEDVREEDLLAAGIAVVAPFILAHILDEAMPTLGQAPLWQADSAKEDLGQETMLENQRQAAKSQATEASEATTKPQAAQDSAALLKAQPARASEAAAKPEAALEGETPAKSQATEVKEAAAKPQTAQVKAEPAKDQPAKSEAVAKPRITKLIAVPVKEQPAKSEAAAKLQTEQASAAPAMDQATKASEAAAKPQTEQVKAEPAKDQPAKSEVAAKPQPTQASAAPAMDQPAKSAAAAKPRITKLIAVPVKEQPAKSEAAAKPQPTQASAVPAKEQATKASKAAAKPQPTQASAAPAKEQATKACEVAAKPQPTQAMPAPAKTQPAKSDKTAEKTKPAQASGTATATRATQASIPLPFDKDHPTGEGLRELFKLSGTSEEGFAWNIGVGMPTLNRWLKVEGVLSIRSTSVQKICKYQTKVMKRLAKA